MRPENTDNQPPLEQRTGERIIQPLNPVTVVPPPAVISPTQPSVATLPTTTLATVYDPTTANNPYRVPSLEYKKPPEDRIRPVALRHTSLLILAIVGLASTAFTIYEALLLNRAIQHALAL